ncbi:hypothetical protein [Spongiimicrobium sp. 3-5]|uniref:hypothetical protein n=1 Tax=Spongiimicrobium sp. 3-5 TaxID=3332596 RepID=UPI0039814205
MKRRKKGLIPSLLMVMGVVSSVLSQNPGGVTGSSVWFKADEGVYENNAGTNTAENGDVVRNWAEQSGNATLTQVRIRTGNPRFRQLGANFNPMIELDGNDMLRNIGGRFSHTAIIDNTENTFFMVKNRHSFSGVEAGFSNASADRAGYYEGFGNRQRVDYGNPNQAMVGTINSRNVYSLARYGTSNASANRTLALNGTTDVSLGSLNSMAGAPTGRFGFGAEPRFIFAFSTVDIAEYLIYPLSLNMTDVEKVESYLGIKYGITLGHNYYASDWNGTTGTILWTLGGGYDNDIAGIGRDDASELNQKQSRSENSDALVTIGLGNIQTTNIANTNTFATDRNFLVWGNDNASTTVINTGIPNGFVEKINRNWQINETGSVDTTLVQIPNSAVTGFSSTSALVMVVADNDTFKGNVVTVPLIQNGTNWEASFDFDGIKHFTFGIVTSPDFMRHGKSFQWSTKQSMEF